MKELRRSVSVVFTVSVFALVALTASCKGGAKEKTTFESVVQTTVNFHVQEVVAACGTPLKILDIKEFGTATRHIIYWVLLKEKPDGPKLEAIVRSVLGETIAHNPETYHVFTIHFFDEEGYRGKPDRSREFAKASYLPEGLVEKAGRDPIDNYRGYKLSLKFM